MRVWLWTAVALVLGGYILSAPLAGRWMLERLANQYPEMPVSSCPTADAIAVLAGTGPPRAGEMRRGEPLNRMEAGITLLRAGRAPRLVMATDGEEAKGLREIPDDRVLQLRPARDTADEARRIVGEARQQSWHRLILVTSGFHMGRALREFRRAAERAGVELTVIPFAADPQVYERWPPAAKSWAPSISGWEFSTRALREMFGQVGF
uniref:DUF218 domain-containing protein n=1 Tax=Solibacter usitatus (strain Ellin6076) TaxID=234267 RepID=Q01XI4_SOLUE